MSFSGLSVGCRTRILEGCSLVGVRSIGVHFCPMVCSCGVLSPGTSIVLRSSSVMLLKGSCLSVCSVWTGDVWLGSKHLNRVVIWAVICAMYALKISTCPYVASKAVRPESENDRKVGAGSQTANKAFEHPMYYSPSSNLLYESSKRIALRSVDYKFALCYLIMDPLSNSVDDDNQMIMI